MLMPIARLPMRRDTAPSAMYLAIISERAGLRLNSWIANAAAIAPQNSEQKTMASAVPSHIASGLKSMMTSVVVVK
jgi:hypothetical protein